MIRATRFRSAANVTSQVGTAIAAKVLLLGLALFWTGFAQAQSANLQFQAQQNPGAFEWRCTVDDHLARCSETGRGKRSAVSLGDLGLCC